MNEGSRRFEMVYSLLPHLSYGELAVVEEWLYARLPEAEKEPGLTWEIAHHVQMARLLDTKNYARARAVFACMEANAAAISGAARERRVTTRIL